MTFDGYIKDLTKRFPNNQNLKTFDTINLDGTSVTLLPSSNKKPGVRLPMSKKLISSSIGYIVSLKNAINENKNPLALFCGYFSYNNYINCDIIEEVMRYRKANDLKLDDIFVEINDYATKNKKCKYTISTKKYHKGHIGLKLTKVTSWETFVEDTAFKIEFKELSPNGVSDGNCIRLTKTSDEDLAGLLINDSSLKYHNTNKIGMLEILLTEQKLK